jgi:hypothetical protein
MRTNYLIMILLITLLMSTCLAIVTTNGKADTKMHSSVIPHFLQKVNAANAQNNTMSDPTKPASKDRPSISLLANGSENTSIIAGGDIVLSCTFSTGYLQGTFTSYVDLNANNAYDPTIDVQIDQSATIIDNDFGDENPAVGIYQYTMSGNEDGPNTVANLRILFRVVDGGGSDIALVHILPITSGYSIAGSVTPALSTIIVMASVNEDESYMTTTNTDGSYLLYVPTATHYHVGCFDPVNVTGGMVCTTTYDNLLINGHLTGYNFVFTAPNSSISGYVRDQDNLPVSNIMVRANTNQGGSEFSASTDNDGYYHIGLASGTWYLNTDTNPDYNNYLSGQNHVITLGDQENLTTNFTIYATNGTIQGSTYLDGQLTGSIPVRADCPLGSSYTSSSANGTYILKVSSFVDSQGGNFLYVPTEELPDNMYCLDNYQNIMSGAISINFNVHIATGGIQGTFYNSQTSQPITDGAWVSAYTNNSNFNANADNNGTYQMGLPAGTYNVTAGGNNYYSSTVSNVSIGNTMITMNFNMVPVVFTGSLSGTVTNSVTSQPIAGVNIQVNEPNYSQYAFTDAQGYYSVQLPNGTFTLYANTPNYFNAQLDNLTINNNNLTQNFTMTPSVGIDDPINPLPADKLGLLNYPNPFNPETTISYNLPIAGNVRIDVLNIRGQLVRTLQSGQETAGIHNVKWNGTDSNGKSMASGVYLYRISTPAQTIINKMLLLK